MEKPLILVVEDDSVLRRVIELLACRNNVDVDLVSNGQAALLAFHNCSRYSLVLMDWRMPDIDGLECTRRIRACERKSGSHIPIIAMTANVSDEDKQKCMDVGMDDYMGKPFSSEQFRDMLFKWLAPDVLKQAI